MSLDTGWRDDSPAQLLDTKDREAIWPQVRVIHAQWKVTEPRIKIGEVTARLLEYAIEHAEEARLAAASRERPYDPTRQ